MTVILERCSGFKASDLGHGTRGQGDGGCGDGVLDGLRRFYVLSCQRHQHHRRRHEHGGESPEVDHGCAVDGLSWG